MRKSLNLKSCIAVVVFISMLTVTAGQAIAQSQGGGGQGGSGHGRGSEKASSKKDVKKADKDAKKLAATAEKAAHQLGRNVVFCVLAAHTTDVGTAQELRDRFEQLTDVPFGLFVAAVLMSDRTEIPLDDILTKLQDGMSLGQIAKEADVSMSELRKGFGEARSELARSITNPPTTDCFSSGN
jgi:hypothetical protein